eukprot:TRINITY_DN1636_c0_g1_i1.p1 TRINITY_DN1636_c0_g1~~TRINITY_DN1636_c0_g1_i1.p1  ORF type:complete len:168 (+),score=22.64 TRINITY_DN1636_c0_g1_i1:322-825(+)
MGSILGYTLSALIGGLLVTVYYWSRYSPQGTVHKKDDGSANSSSSSSNQTDTKATRPYNERDEYKMVLVVRNDLKMEKGKIAAQCSHATLGAYKRAMKRKLLTDLDRWENHSGQAKVVLKCESEEELLSLREKVIAEKINEYLVCDAGRTQVEPNTLTVLAIGPALK